MTKMMGVEIVKLPKKGELNLNFLIEVNFSKQLGVCILLLMIFLGVSPICLYLIGTAFSHKVPRSGAFTIYDFMLLILTGSPFARPIPRISHTAKKDLCELKWNLFNFDMLITFCFGISSNLWQQKSPIAEVLHIYFLRTIFWRKFMRKIWALLLR